MARDQFTSMSKESVQLDAHSKIKNGSLQVKMNHHTIMGIRGAHTT